MIPMKRRCETNGEGCNGSLRSVYKRGLVVEGMYVSISITIVVKGSQIVCL